MAVFKTDLRDIYFTLFEKLNAQELSDAFEENDLKEIINEFNKFVENELYPCRMEGDEQGAQIIDGQVKAPECYRKPQAAFYENGWYGLGYPEEIGGIPVPEAVTVACKELAIGANVGFTMYFSLTHGAMNVILKIGTDAQKEKFVAPMMSGAWGGTMCLTEAGAGSDVGALKSTAKPLGDNKYSIAGTKIFISSGDNDLYENIIHLVLARTPGAPEGTKGLSLFIVPKFNINDDGSNGEANDVLCKKIEEKMGLHGSSTCEITFGENGNCVGELIGKEGEGIQNMFIMMNEARMLCGIQGEAQAQLIYELTKQYTEERAQFGKEIIKHPDVKRMMLKMRALSRGMRGLIYYTAKLFDLQEKGQDTEAEIALLTPVCKAYCTDEGFNLAVDAIQIHGGYGYCTEYGIEQFARDIKVATIYEGTNGIQAIDLVMRKILKDQGQAFGALAAKMQKSMGAAAGKGLDGELAFLGKQMEKGQQVLMKYGEWAKANNFDRILESATDFLAYCGNTITTWILLDHALLALEKIEGASGDDKVYYQSKVDDFKVFVQHILTRNTGITQSILSFEEGISQVEV